MGEPRKCKFETRITCGLDFDPKDLQECLLCLLNLSFRDFQHLYAVVQTASIPIKNGGAVFNALENHVSILTAFKEFLKINFPEKHKLFFPEPKIPEAKEPIVPYSLPYIS